MLYPKQSVVTYQLDSGMCMDDGTCAAKDRKCISIPPKPLELSHHSNGSEILAHINNITQGCSMTSTEIRGADCVCVGKTIHFK